MFSKFFQVFKSEISLRRGAVILHEVLVSYSSIFFSKRMFLVGNSINLY